MKSTGPGALRSGEQEDARAPGASGDREVEAAARPGAQAASGTSGRTDPPGPQAPHCDDLDATLQALVGMLCDAVGATRGSLLLETSPGRLRIRAARGLSQDVATRTAIDHGHGIAGGVAASGVPRLVRDAARARGGPPLLDYTADSALCVPLRHGDRVLGVANLSNKRAERHDDAPEFDERDLRRAASLAEQAARVIVAAEDAAAAETRMRLEHSLAAANGERREAAALAVMGLVTDELLDAGPLDRVLHGIVRRATALLGATRGSLLLRAPGSDEMRIAAALGLPAQVVADTRVRVGEGIAGHCAATGEALLLDDARAAREGHERELSQYRSRSAICVPLRVRHEVLGVLSLNDRCDGKEFSREDLVVARVIANQAALAIRTSRLVEDASQAAGAREALAVAREIQGSFLPTDRREARWAASALSIPADAAGGDYVDFWERRDAAERPTGEIHLALGDATGHGLGSALVAASCRALLRALLLESRDLAAVMRQLDCLLQRDLRRGQFITLFLGLLDPDSGRLVYTSAGHPPGLLAHPGVGVSSELRATGPPLGIGSRSEFPPCEAQLEPGDTLVLVSDGVSEARNAAREPFGDERLHATVSALAEAGPRPILDGLRRRVAAHTHPTPLADDLSALALRLHAPGAGAGG